MESITTIVRFKVPTANIEEFLQLWYGNQEMMSRQPGLVDGVFHRAVDPEGPFQFINVARWESAEALGQALKTVGEEQQRRGNAQAAALGRLGVEITQENYAEELRY